VSVHIGELRTDIVPADGPPSGSGGERRDDPDRARDTAERARWLTARVAATGFDD
jgi:hypothetical protein